MSSCSQTISRRNMMLGSSALATSGCTSTPELSVFIANALFIPAAVGLVVNVISAHIVEPMITALSHVVPAAEAAEANKDVCIAAAQVAGSDFVIECLKEKVPIWASYNQNVPDANSFKVNVVSHSSDPRENSGQIEFELRDSLTGRVEKVFLGDPFKIPPYGKGSVTYGPYKRASFAPGPKRIAVRRAPTGIKVKDVELAILPMSIRV